MGLRGRKRRLTVEDEYWGLIGSGLGTVEACRRVGIGRHTGYRWRAERGGMPPARLTREVSGRYLSLLERERIAALRRIGLGVRAIARELGQVDWWELPLTLPVARDVFRKVSGLVVTLPQSAAWSAGLAGGVLWLKSASWLSQTGDVTG